MILQFIFVFAVSICLVGLSSCYPHGAPQETCKIFTANHTGHLPQTTEPKYEIIIDPTTLSPGDKATVTIQGVNGETFKGFFIQGQDQSASDQPVGKFENQDDAQVRDCSSPGSSDSATHVNADEKPKVVLHWQSPANFHGKVVFRAVIVKTYELFWDKLLSSPVTVA